MRQEILASRNHVDIGQIGCLLRDYFMAQSGETLVQQYTALRSAGCGLPVPESPDAHEFAFNRLFVGPAGVLAPPYASAYLEEDGLVMGRATREARTLYRAFGLCVPHANTIPDDHVSYEIDACLHIRQLATSEEELQAYATFVAHHMHVWVQAFAQRVACVPDAPESIRALVVVLVTWLERELDHVSSMLKGAEHESIL